MNTQNRPTVREPDTPTPEMELIIAKLRKHGFRLLAVSYCGTMSIVCCSAAAVELGVLDATKPVRIMSEQDADNLIALVARRTEARKKFLEKRKEMYGE